MEIKKYFFGETEVWYMINENKNVFFHIIPSSMKNEVKKYWEYKKDEWNPRGENGHAWVMGNLAYFQLSEENYFRIPVTMKNDILMQEMTLEYHERIIKDNQEIIITTLKNEKGYKLVHTLTYTKNLKGFEIQTEFINNSDKAVTLEMLSSFSMDNISPFQEDDGDEIYKLHRFNSGWSLEGKHTCISIEDLGIERNWGGFRAGSEKFGSKGSYPTERYFPTAAIEDTSKGVIWAARLAHNATWQMEISRIGDNLSLSGGLGDNDFCGWSKIINSGEGFKAPKAHIAVVKGDIYDACNALNDMLKPAYTAYGEGDLGICFNEYCATWGRPTQEKMLRYSDSLKDLGVKYAVIDAGWCIEGCEQNCNGEWGIDKNIFPDMKEMNRQLREKGIIPGIWFEFEVTTKGSKLYEKEYDFMHLMRNGNVLNINDFRSFWDFRREDVREYLYEKVIKFLKDYGFGYIKVDYNDNTGIAVDGAESGAEGLRQHLECVRNFFIDMKKEIPDLIIENCSSGGNRLEPSMMGVSAVSSFSDAHEALEIPYIASNLHNLILPAQSLIWAVLHNDDSIQREVYSLAAGFLGRICLSGQIDELSPQQKDTLKSALAFYKKLDNIILNGSTKIYGNRGNSMHHPKGVQIVVRKTDDEILVVCHGFKNAEGKFNVEIPFGFEITDSFYGENISIHNNELVIENMADFSAGAVLLRRINA